MENKSAGVPGTFGIEGASWRHTDSMDLNNCFITNQFVGENNFLTKII